MKPFALALVLALLAAAPACAGIGRPQPDHDLCQHWGDIALMTAQLRDQGKAMAVPLSVIEHAQTPRSPSTDNYRNMIHFIYARPGLSPMAAKETAKAYCYALKLF